MGIQILGIGSALPNLKIHNKDFEKIVDTTDEWIYTRTGMQERYLTDGEPNYMMASRAATAAIDDANIPKAEIDLVIVSTVTQDFHTPSTSCLLQHVLGLTDTICIDISCGCEGFISAIDMANRYLKDDEIRNVLVVASEQLSKITDYNDRSTCVLMADAASACVVTRDDSKIYSSFIGSQGSGAPFLYAKNIAPKHPFINEETAPKDELIPNENNGFLYMNGKEVYKFAVTAMPLSVEKACKKIGIAPSELDYIVPHQANIRIIQTASEKMGIPIEKFWVNIHKYGNTSSATIPLCLDEMKKSGILKSGMKIGLVGFGAGLNYGANIIEL